ncbi:hypothetical protein P2318_10765 [Myxococcaceae bacterium GXIMD 01537]
MTTARIVLLIALLAPLLGRAQEVPSEAALPPPPLLSAPPGKDPSRASPLEERYSVGARVGLQLPLALVGALAGGVAGLGGAELIGSQGRERETHRIALSLVGGGLGAAGAVYGAGAILDMEGSFLHTLLGAGVGVAIPSLGYLAGVGDIKGSNQAGVLVMLGMAGLACPIIAQELSHAEARKEKAAGLRVYPVAAAGPGGGSLGLAGRF